MIIIPQRIVFKENGTFKAWLAIDSNGKGSLQLPHGGYASFYNGNNQTNINGDKITTPVLEQTSLKSKKKNIERLNINATELISNTDICLYNLKNEKEGSKQHIGLVIGEEYNCPDEVISESREGIEQYSMISISWKALQEIITEMNNLKEKINKLEGDIKGNSNN